MKEACPDKFSKYETLTAGLNENDDAIMWIKGTDLKIPVTHNAVRLEVLSEHLAGSKNILSANKVHYKARKIDKNKSTQKKTVYLKGKDGKYILVNTLMGLSAKKKQQAIKNLSKTILILPSCKKLEKPDVVVMFHGFSTGRTIIGDK